MTVPQDGVDAIKVVVTDLTVPTTVGWPLKCEGNLKDLRPKGSGGGGGSTEWHWSAKISKFVVDLDTDTNNNGTIDDYEDEYEEYPSGRVVCQNREGDGKDLDDLAEIRLRVENSTDGTVTLEEIGDKVKVWDNPDKTGNPIISPSDNSETWPVGEMPSQLWVDGVTLGQSTLKLSHKDQQDLIKIFVCDPISWSPRGNTLYVYEPYLANKGGSDAIWNKVQSCGWTIRRRYVGMAQCTLARLKEPGQTDPDLRIGIVAYHSLGTHNPPLDTVEVARGTEAEMIAWMGNEPNMSVGHSELGLEWAVKAKAAWFQNKWKAKLDANRAIVVMMACNTYPNITAGVGGRSAFGYLGDSHPDLHGPNMNLLFGRLNGSEANRKWRTTGRAYGALGFQDDFRLYLTPVGEQYPPPEINNPQALWTTLNPSPNKNWVGSEYYLTFPTGPANRKGAGCIVFDTYLEDEQGDNGQDPSKAVKVKVGTGVTDRRWFPNAGGNDFLVSFDFEHGGVTMQADADFCLNLDTDEAAPRRKMSGERLESGKDKEWAF